MSLKEGVEINISRARWVSGYVIEVAFSDGCSRKVDFEPFLEGSLQPEVRKYLDLDAFKGVSICFGNLVWNDYDLCFPMEDLYTGGIVAQGQSSRRVAEQIAEYQVGN